MNINGTAHRTISLDESDSEVPLVYTIDQRFLPHELRRIALKTSNDVATAIEEMWLRGAPLIGAAAALGFYLGLREADPATWDRDIKKLTDKLLRTRPTAVNLHWAVARQLTAIEKGVSYDEKIGIARQTALDIIEEDVAICKQIGEHGLKIIEYISNQKSKKIVNVLTHCNAGWLACIDWGTATAPIYLAHQKGIAIHVWVDETRPRMQGSITAYELAQQGVPHTVISDNTGGLLLQQGLVDLCIVGTDRTTRTGDVANKIGTYLKALAAHDNNVPFYVALPSHTFDFSISNGLTDIPIETRSEQEVLEVQGVHAGELKTVRLFPTGTRALNYGFDITPARLITGLITERGVCEANEEAIKAMFPQA
ncbi:MAG: hypothetical protein RI894_245 [Bacteroidota bacterium]|jgi:methylthioribose-1-phosphate isomerase